MMSEHQEGLEENSKDCEKQLLTAKTYIILLETTLKHLETDYKTLKQKYNIVIDSCAMYYDYGE